MKYTLMIFTVIFSLSLFAGDKSKNVTLNVSGMTCQSCVSTVEKTLKKMEGVEKVKVDLQQKQATVTLSAKSTTTPVMLAKAVSDAGFTASEQKSPVKKTSTMKSKSDDGCGDGCCGDECGTEAKPAKSKKTEAKKS
ncbi:MAG: heavy-metal-associated domain-containing protein [Bacteroidota bacterium]